MRALSFRVSPELEGERLDRVVAAAPFAREEGVSRKTARSLIERGAVTVSGKRVLASSRRVQGGELVRVSLPAAQKPRAPQVASVRILFQDDVVLAIDKPAGIPSVPTRDPARPSALSLAKARLKSETAFLEAPHRLDRDTSGVLLLAKDARSLAALSESFREGRAKKTYVALVHGTVEKDSFRVESFLAPAKHARGEDERWHSVRAGGKKAITAFRVLARGEDRTLVECLPETGRTHQIRVHLGDAGHPIVGDELYGAPGGEHAREGRHFLHARLLEIPHPSREGETLTIESSLPEGFSAREGPGGSGAS